MDIDDYAATTLKTAIYPGSGTGSREAVEYTIIGLAGESGEALEMIKKLKRGDFGPELLPSQSPDGEGQGSYSQDFAEPLRKELGDIAWYWARACQELGVDPSDVLADNLNKLKDRQERGVIQGSGNSR